MSRSASWVHLRAVLDSHPQQHRASDGTFSSLEGSLRSVLDDRSWLGTVGELPTSLL